jgi:hypothetical protein
MSKMRKDRKSAEIRNQYLPEVNNNYTIEARDSKLYARYKSDGDM